MSTSLLLLIVLALVTVYFWHARKNNKQKLKPVSKKAGKAVDTKSIRPTHRCVVIEPGLLSCQAIGAYVTKPILMDQAPILPVQGCDAQKCECKFLRYDDRRMGVRRDKIKAANHIISATDQNKRSKKERRHS